MRDPPDRHALGDLHRRLLCGDRLASEALVCLVLPCLQEEIARRFPGTDEHVISDGSIDAVLDYCAHPDQFDVSKDVPLDRFLATASWRNVNNLLTSERRRKRREQKVARENRDSDVAHDPVARNIWQEELQQLDEKQAAIFAALDDPKDKEILALRLQEIRATAPYARVLNITHLPLKQQRDEVKRHKDRITRLLRRKGLLP